MECTRQDRNHLILHGNALHLFISLGEALDGANCVVHQVKHLVIIGNELLVDHLTSETNDQVGILNIAPLNYLCQQLHEVLLDEHAVIVALLGVYEQATHRLIQIVEDAIEVDVAQYLVVNLFFRHFVSALLGHQLALERENLIEHLEEYHYVGATNLECTLWHLDAEHTEAALQQRLQKYLLVQVLLKFLLKWIVLVELFSEL